MEKRSKHPMDVLKWIEKVIDSCETYRQTLVADKLIYRCYKDMYLKNENYNSPLYNEWKRVNWRIVSKQEELANK